jgi:nucleoside-diphosphate kinase
MSGGVVGGVDFARWAVVLCKPDAVERGLVDTVLQRISTAGIEVSERTDLVAAPWQAHVAYRDLLARSGGHTVPDLPARLDAEFAGRTVTVALAHGEPGVHQQLRDLLGHFDPTKAAAGTIRGDLGDDSLTAALAERRLVRNLVHTSDDPDAARRDFGTWYGAARAGLLVPLQRTTPTDLTAEAS